MTRKHWFLVTSIVLLGALSLYLNRDWFETENIQIYHRSRPARATLFARKNPSQPEAANPVTFGFDRQLKLTSLKVVLLAEFQTNRFAHPVWELVSDSNSVPVKEFLYGMRLRGMRPVVKEARPDPLRPNVPYRLLVETADFKGVHDFTPIPRTR